MNPYSGDQQPRPSSLLHETTQLQPQDSIDSTTAETQNLLLALPSSSAAAADGGQQQMEDPRGSKDVAGGWPASKAVGMPQKRSWWDLVRTDLSERVRRSRSAAHWRSFHRISRGSLSAFGCIRRRHEVVATVQVAARKSSAGTGSCMTGRSLGVFGIRNPVRCAVYRILCSQVRHAPDMHAECPCAFDI